MTGCGCFFCGCSLGALRQTCQLRLVCDEALHIIAVGLGNDVVTEFEREQCQFLVNLFEALFLVLRQVGPVVGEVLVGLGHQSHLLGVKTELFALVIDELNALEQLVVKDDTVAQFAQHRAYLLGDSIHLVVTVRLEHIEENAHHAVQQQTGTVEGLNRVLESRFGFVVGDSLYFGFLLGYSCFESRNIMF